MAEVGLPIALGPCIPVPSRLKIHEWHAISTAHEDDKLVLDRVEFAFSLQYTSPLNPTSPNTSNHSSANEYQPQVDEYIAKEVDMGPVIGPALCKILSTMSVHAVVE